MLFAMESPHYDIFTKYAKMLVRYEKICLYYNINEAQLDRFRKNSVIKTVTIDRLCKILDCNVEDICQYVKDEPEE